MKVRARIGASRRGANRLKGCAVFVATLAGLLLVLIGLASAWAGVRRSAWRGRSDGPLLIVPEARLGWTSTANRNLPLGPGGGSFTTDPQGLRRDDSHGHRPLLLVLGDSFTHAAGVPDGSVYYDEVARRLDLGVMAIGVGGYGTTQEFLAASAIRASGGDPDFLLLQMCGNDPINNSWALERESWINNNLLPRPYLNARGEVEMRDPRRLHEKLVLGREITRRLLAPRLSSIENRLGDGDREALVLYRRELDATERALRALRGVFPEIPAFAFHVGGGGGSVGADLERLSREAGFDYLELEPEFSTRGRGRELLQADGQHWNTAGHELAGEILARGLAERRVDAGQVAPGR